MGLLGYERNMNQSSITHGGNEGWESRFRHATSSEGMGASELPEDGMMGMGALGM